MIIRRRLYHAIDAPAGQGKVISNAESYQKLSFIKQQPQDLVYRYMNSSIKPWILFFAIAGILTLCHKKIKTQVNSNPMDDVDLARYAGKWYEIARLPNHLNNELEDITYSYKSINASKLSVLNIAYMSDGKKHEKKGQANIENHRITGALEISFVWPYIWYKEAYHILYVSPDYNTALVSSNHANSLCLLARSPSISEEQKLYLLELADKRGFDTSNLIWPHQST